MTDMKAIVIGAGPAGLSASLGLLQAGFEVEILEQRNEWKPRVCGSFLSPEASLHLKALGVFESVSKESSPCREAEIYLGKDRFQVPIERNGNPGLSIPRKRLEEILIKKATEQGARIHFGARAESCSREKTGWTIRILRSGKPGSADLTCDILIAADGRFSGFRTPSPHPAKKRGWLGFNAEFEGVSGEPGSLSLHFFPKGYAGLLQFPDGRSNISGLLHSDLKGGHENWDRAFEKILTLCPSLKLKLKAAKRKGPWAGVGALPFGRYAGKKKGPILAGDAAGVCDPYMGEGIARALGAGPMIFEALSGPLEKMNERYAQIWKKRYGNRSRIGRPIRKALCWPKVFPLFFRAVKNSPSLERRILSTIHSF